MRVRIQNSKLRCQIMNQTVNVEFSVFTFSLKKPHIVTYYVFFYFPIFNNFCYFNFYTRSKAVYIDTVRTVS